MSTNTEQRKLAAIMFTDMVGYRAMGHWGRGPSTICPKEGTSEGRRAIDAEPPNPYQRGETE